MGTIPKHLARLHPRPAIKISAKPPRRNLAGLRRCVSEARPRLSGPSEIRTKTRTSYPAWWLRSDRCSIDDFAVLAMDHAQAKLAFQVISDRYDYRRSTCVTTNRLFKDWPKVFPDALNAQVIAERLTERAEHFLLDGKGYRPTKHDS
jgi:hypothetical protein